MDGSQAFLVCGFVNGRDEKQQPICITLLGVVTRYDLLSLEIVVVKNKVDVDQPIEDLLVAIQAEKEAAGTTLEYQGLCERLKQYIEDRRYLPTLAKNRNVKPTERAINRFCNDTLQLRSVTFLQLREISQQEVKFIVSKNAPQLHLAELPDPVVVPSPEAVAEEPAVQEEAPETQANEEVKEQKDIFIRCEAVLDPVYGVPISELVPGDVVSVALLPQSSFYKLMASQMPNFKGVVQANVTGVLENETGSFTVSLGVAEGILGMMKMNSRVRVRVLQRWNESEPTLTKKNRSPQNQGDFVFILAGFGVLILLMLLVFYVIRKAF